jgi:hypothetical protein
MWMWKYRERSRKWPNCFSKSDMIGLIFSDADALIVMLSVCCWRRCCVICRWRELVL